MNTIKNMNNDILIIYKSKYGATKEYANMLSQKLNCQIIDFKKTKKIDFSPFKQIIYCCGIYLFKIKIVNYIKKIYKQVRNKKIFIFCVGASEYDINNIAQIKQKNLNNELNNIPLFYGRGSLDINKMHKMNKFLCKLLQKILSKVNPVNYEPWMKAIMAAKNKVCNWVDEKYLDEIVSHIKNAYN